LTAARELLALGVGSFEAHRFLYHAVLGLRAIKKKKEWGGSPLEPGRFPTPSSFFFITLRPRVE